MSQIYVVGVVVRIDVVVIVVGVWLILHGDGVAKQWEKYCDSDVVEDAIDDYHDNFHVLLRKQRRLNRQFCDAQQTACW